MRQQTSQRGSKKSWPPLEKPLEIADYEYCPHKKNNHTHDQKQRCITHHDFTTYPITALRVRYRTRMVRRASVVDPHWFQCGSRSSILGLCGSGSESGSDLWFFGGQKIKFYNEKISFFYSRNFSRGLYQGRPSYRRSLLHSILRVQPALQNMKCLHFLQIGGNFCPPRSGSPFPMQTTETNADPCGSGSTTLPGTSWKEKNFQISENSLSIHNHGDYNDFYELRKRLT